MTNTPAPARNTRETLALRARYAAPARTTTTTTTPALTPTMPYAPTAPYFQALAREHARTLMHTAPHMAHAAALAVTPPARPGHLRTA